MDSRWWKAEEVAAAVAIVKHHTSLSDAVAEVSETIRKCTKDSIASAFKRHSKGSPSDYLRKTYTGAPPVDLDDVRDTDVEDLPAPKTDPAPVVAATMPPPEGSSATPRAPPAQLPAILFVPDTHAPYHSVSAWNIMLRAARALQPKHIVVLGDLLDFYSVSAHDKDPKRTSKLAVEVDSARHLIDDLDSLGATEKIFVEGNHEQRLSRYVARVAPQLHGLQGLTLCEILNLETRGWKWVPYKDSTKIGSLSVTHDGGYCGKYAVHHTRDLFRGDVGFGHIHRLGVEYNGDATGRVFYGAAFGWLGDHDAIDYRHKVSALRDYTHGFGVGWLDERTGRVHVQAVPILDGTCVINGMRIA